MIEWKALSFTVRIVLVGVAALLFLGAVYGVYHALTAKPKAEARLAQNQTAAAQANGADAIGVVGAVDSRSRASHTLTRSNADEINKAKGADAPVDPAARDAGLRSLCRRAAYRSDPKCLQFAPSK